MKKKEKAEKKAEVEYQREVRKKREEERLEGERKREEERKRKEEEEEEKARALEEERRRQEEEEYKKWENLISVESEGVGVKEALLNDEARVRELLERLKREKVCVVDELACELDVTGEVGHVRVGHVQELVQALETLEAEGRVMVVVDDRGKVMCISEQEAEAVARMVEREGRISLAKLTAMCDSMIDLKGKWSVCWTVFLYENEESSFGIVSDRLCCV